MWDCDHVIGKGRGRRTISSVHSSNGSHKLVGVVSHKGVGTVAKGVVSIPGVWIDIIVRTVRINGVIDVGGDDSVILVKIKSLDPASCRGTISKFCLRVNGQGDKDFGGLSLGNAPLLQGLSRYIWVSGGAISVDDNGAWILVELGAGHALLGKAVRRVN